MLEVKDLFKKYKSKSGVTVDALKGVSLKFPKKGMIFILGKSGSGKSTLLNVLGGLDSFDSGDILVNGESTKDFKQSHFDSFRNTYVGFIFQEYNILDNFTVGQNIALAMQLQSRKPTSENIDQILEEVDLKGLGDRKPNELSGGQKQRVAIARALIKNPQIIMADEPTGALDSNTGIQIFDTLKKLSKDKLVIIISHDREFSERYADRIIELKDGNVISDVSLVNSRTNIEEEKITLNGNEIIVKSDYVLKQSDLKVINSYLKKIKTDASIVTSTKAGQARKKQKFVKTNEANIKIEKTGFDLIKSKLPMKRAFQMGASGLKHKKFKLAMTIVLSLVAFTMLGMSMTMALTDQTSGIANALSSSQINQLSVEKAKYTINNFAGNTVIQRTSGDGFPMDDSESSKVQEACGGKMIKEYRYAYNDEQSYTSYNTFNISEISEKSSTHQNAVYISNITRFAQATSDELTDSGYTFEDASKETVKDNSVYISRYLFDSLVAYNCELKDAEGNNPITLNNNSKPGDVLNRRLTIGYSSPESYVIIQGVFNTGFDIKSERYSPYLGKTYLDQYNGDLQTNEIITARDKNIESCLVGVNSKFLDYVDKNIASSYKRKLTTLVKKHDFSNSMSNKSLLSKISIESKINEKHFYRFCLNNTATTRIEDLFSSVLGTMRPIFLYIGLAFIVFSGLLLANFIANSISYQKREIGILRAIGARGKDVFKVYISEAFIIAAINFCLSIVSTWAVIAFGISPQFSKLAGGIAILKFGIVEILILLAVSFLSAFIATYLPVRNTAKKKPVEAIRNK